MRRISRYAERISIVIVQYFSYDPLVMHAIERRFFKMFFFTMWISLLKFRLYVYYVCIINLLGPTPRETCKPQPFLANASRFSTKPSPADWLWLSRRKIYKPSPAERAILCTTTQFTSYAQNVHHRPKRTLGGRNGITSPQLQIIA